MAVSQRTPTSGAVTAAATLTVTLPSGTAIGDLLVVAIGATNTTDNPAAPTGWTKYGPYSPTTTSLSIYIAPYSAGLTLNFGVQGFTSAWVCNAYFQAASTISLDGAPVAAFNTTANTTLPTGAPTTGTSAGDYEVLAYCWNSGATISGVASGSTIDVSQLSSSAPTVALGHNNTTSLPASTTVTAFSQTLSLAQTRKTGVGLLLKGTGTSVVSTGGLEANVDVGAGQVQVGHERLEVDVGAGQAQIGSHGLNVDDLPAPPAPRPGSMALNVDYTYLQGVHTGHEYLEVDLQQAGQVRTGGLRVDAELRAGAPRLGTTGVMVDYVLLTHYWLALWDGTHFQIEGDFPEVVWNTDHFEQAP